ncbi:LIM-domain binding protein-domain-containing protein [Mucor mucedo]|uniref:LIM-domain binding protein-domain-containing protein n=1 Tax=Mucor mucedo TaxID=29922 RepID=UPI00221F5B80|nr:LIM-domain binding protein-domain-containing protein [Mucor mucedo]KAI7892971.1 LIM-domain binding protein-domain-containing protein [Mucor mucedo]
MQQQQAQLLFRQRQLQQQQRPLPPTPTLSSQGSPNNAALAAATQIGLPLPSKSMFTPTTAVPATAAATPQQHHHHRPPSMGQAVLRLLQFRDQLSPGDQAKEMSFWRGFVDDFFTSNAIMKLALVDQQTQQRNEFEITQSLIARFFYTHYQCDLESIQLTTDQTMEYFLPTGMMLECPRSSLIHRYTNGTLVILSGELSVLFNSDPNDGLLKIHQWKFTCHGHDEYIARSQLSMVDVNAASITKKKLKSNNHNKTPTVLTPQSLVNQWGLPERVYQLLRIIDTSARLGEVAFFSLVTGLNPKDALTAMSFSIHQKMTGSYPPQPQVMEEDLLTTDILSLLPTKDSPFISTLTTTNTPTPTMAPPPLPPPSSNTSPMMNPHMMHPPTTPNPLMSTPTMATPNMSTPTMPTPTMSSMPTPVMTTPIMTTPIMTTPIMTTPIMATPTMTTPTMPPPPQPPVQHAQQVISNMNAPAAHLNPQSTQFMQQAALQRYYHQQSIRMQHQQQALQMQQRQALQRLQQPFIKDLPQTPPPVDEKQRKRKASVSKDGKNKSNNSIKKTKK